MHIRPPSASQVTSPQNSSTPSAKTEFAQAMNKAQATQKTAELKSVQKMDLSKLASDLKSGKISQEDACKQFVELAVHQDVSKNIRSAVSDVLVADPQFMSRLETQLKKLS